MTDLELKISTLSKRYTSKIHDKPVLKNQHRSYNAELKRIEDELIAALGELNQCPFLPPPEKEHLTVETYIKRNNDE